MVRIKWRTVRVLSLGLTFAWLLLLGSGGYTLAWASDGTSGSSGSGSSGSGSSGSGSGGSGSGGSSNSGSSNSSDDSRNSNSGSSSNSGSTSNSGGSSNSGSSNSGSSNSGSSNSGSSNSGSSNSGSDDGRNSGSSNSGSSNSGSSSSDDGRNSGSSTNSVSSNNSGRSGDIDRMHRKVETRELFEGFEAELAVKVEVRPDRNRLGVEVENVNLAPGTTLNVCLNGQSLGSIMLDASHAGELELEARDGAAVPSISPSDIVEVRQGGCSASSSLILATRFDDEGVMPPVAGVPHARLEAEAQGVFEGFESELNVKVESLPDRSRFSAEVDNVNLPPGTMLNVCVSGQSLGSIVLDAFHAGELNLDSREAVAVPSIKPSDIIEVRQGGCSASANLILAAKIGGGAMPPAAGAPRIRLAGQAEHVFAGFETELGVKFERRPDRIRFSAEVENVNLPPGTMLNVCLGGQSLGSIVLDALHSGELNLDSREGFSVPAINPLDVIEVRQGACSDASKLILTAKIR